MISVFNNRSRTLDGAKTDVYVQLSVEMRQHLHLLKGASLSVFLAIALHADENGFAFPSVQLLCKETGYKAGAIFNALADLRGLKIEGKRVLCYVQRSGEKGKFASNGYLIFPSPDEAARYDDGKAARDENHAGVARRVSDVSPHTEKPYAVEPNAAQPNAAQPNAAQPNAPEPHSENQYAKYNQGKPKPSGSRSINKETPAEAYSPPAPTEPVSASESLPVAVAFLDKNNEASELVALIAALEITEADAASIVHEALRDPLGAEKVRRNAAWFPSSKQARAARNVGATFRAAVRDDWAKADENEAQARENEAKSSHVARRYVTAPTTAGARQNGKIDYENIPRPGDLAARFAPTPPAPTAAVGQAELDDIYASLSSCAHERLHKEAVKQASEGAPPFVLEELRRLPVNLQTDARGAAARLVIAQRNLILRERAKNPFVVNSKKYYDKADALAVERDLHFN